MSTKPKRLKKVLDKQVGPLSFGMFMRAARTTRDMSQVEMANFLGISKSTLCDIEKGRQIVSIELASKIARQCELSEALAVKATITDQLRRAGIKFNIEIKSA